MTTKFDGAERRAPQRWRFNKEVSLADLLSFASAALAVVYAYTTLDKRVAILEGDKTVQSATDKRQDDDSLRYQMRLETVVSEINRKLDRLIERAPLVGDGVPRYRGHP